MGVVKRKTEHGRRNVRSKHTAAKSSKKLQQKKLTDSEKERE